MLEGDRYASIETAVTDGRRRGQAGADAGRTRDATIVEDCLPDELDAAALVMLEDQIRPDAAETLAYFAEQGVTLKVISGDNPRTVGAVCRRVGLAGRRRPDRRPRAADRRSPSSPTRWMPTTVFGRVTPHQKRAMVKALQSRGHVVAMTGDGVNDVLALKDADCGIAMASGSEATRAVAQLVLLDSSFTALPAVLAEGRRVINNIERVASLFLVKTTYAMFFALATVFSAIPYPVPAPPPHARSARSRSACPRSSSRSLRTPTVSAPGSSAGCCASRSPVVCVASIGDVRRLPHRPQHRGALASQQERTTATLVLAACAILVLVRVARPLVAVEGRC